METITRARRVGYAALSGLAGWGVAVLCCTPVLLITAVRNSEGQPRLFVQTLFYGVLAWAGWTFLLALAAWIFVALPVVLLIRPALLVRQRRVILVCATAFALWLAASRPTMFCDPTGETFLHKFGEIIPYAAFAVAYTVTTAWTYIAMSKRRLETDASESLSPPEAG